MKKKYTVYGPVQDGQFSVYQVIGPRGGVKATCVHKKAADAYAKYLNAPKTAILLGELK